MKTRHIFLLGIMSLTLTGLTGCGESFLDVESPTADDVNEYYTTDDHIQEALVAAYAPLHWADWGNGSYAPTNLCSDIMSDDCYPGGATASDMLAWQLMFNFKATSENTRYSSSYSDSAYYRKAGDNTVECKVKNRNGISDGSIIQTFHVNKTKMNGFAGFVADSKYNMWRQEEASAHKPNTFFYAPGWSQIADPNYSMDGYDYENITLPKATSEQWQAQMHLPSNISLSAANNYDFSVILTSNTDHNGVTIKVTDVSDDDNFLFTEKTTLKAGEPVCFWKSDLKGIDASQIKIVFDFGGNADNTTINVENIVLKDHANDDGTKVLEIVEDPTVYTYNSPNNIWKQIDDSFDSKMMSFYYANGDSWAANPDPIGFKALGGGKYEVTLPDASSQQWQAQVFFHTDLLGTLLPVKAGENYDMRVKVHATADIPGMTFKVTSADDDKVFFTADRHDITADTDTEIKIPAKSLSADASTVNVVFDFGGAPAGTVVTISDITIQKTAK